VKRVIRVLALWGAVSAAVPARAAAEWQLAPFAGFAFAGDTNLNLVEIEKRHWTIGASGRLLGAGPLGVEALFLFVPGHLEELDIEPLSPGAEQSRTITSARTFAFMGNVVLTTPRAWNEYGLRPYVSGGFGWLHAYHNEPELPLSGSMPAYNVGGGAVGFLTDRTGLRFDLRYFRTAPPGREPTPDFLTTGDRARLRYWTGTIGVVFKY
jgi:hypothetical protein